MRHENQNLSDNLLEENIKIVENNDLTIDHNWYNKVMQINLIRENMDLDYETGFFQDNRSN